MKASIEELSDNLRRLLADLEAHLGNSVDGAGEKLDEAGENVRATLHRVRDHLRSARDEVTNRARKLDSAVHADPWRALVAVAVVAFIAGLLVRRR